MPEFLTIPAGSGQLAATLWPAADPKAVVLVHPATAVTQGFYEHFARWLADLGFTVLTYDYRGTGRSRGASLRGETVTMSGWMDEDVPAVTRWAAARFAALPLLAVGHSVGGHALVLGGGGEALRGAVLVASHAGVTRTIRGAAERARVWLVMRLLAPLSCAIFGYMPGKRIGLGEDLPRGVMLEWSRWTTLLRYFYDDPAVDAARRMAKVDIPLLVLGFEDDPWANRQAVDILLLHLPNAHIERRNIHPREADVPAVGHMGFFRRRCEAVLWKSVADWLLARVEEPAHAPG